jgi:flagellin
MRINTNMAALNAWRNLTVNRGNMQKSLEKLSSGYRINRAADDAAGLAVSEKMRAQIRGTNMAVRNAQDGISLVQTAEGALTETHSILQRMRELAVQASTGTLNSDDSAAVQSEITSLTAEVDRIGNSTKFNNKALLNGDIGAATQNVDAAYAQASGVESLDVSGAASSTGWNLKVEAGSNTGVKYTLTDGTGNVQVLDDQVVPAAGQFATVNFDKLGVNVKVNDKILSAGATALDGTKTFDVASSAIGVQVSANKDTTYGVINISIGDMTSSGLGVNALDTTTTTGAQNAITALDSAITSVSTTRATLGATQNRLEHTVSNLQVTSENLSSAESRIRDVDMAQEMATFTKYNILQQASTAMLAQANQSTQGVLSLLRG